MDKPKHRPLKLDANLIAQFCTAATDIFIEIVKSQDPQLRQTIDGAIGSGGEIEITAHNKAERITVTLLGPSGQRHVIFDDIVSLTEEGDEEPKRQIADASHKHHGGA